MITSVSLNPSIDKSVSIKTFNYGSMNRVIESREDAGGKAINLAYVAKLLGLDVCCVGFTRERGKDVIAERLKNVKTDFITLPGSIRVNTKLLDTSTGVVTEINESGDEVDDESLSRARNMILKYASESDFLVLTGSVPKGCPNSFYAEIIRDAKCRCVLDAEGESLSLGTAQKPYLIKPNKMELELLVGRKLDSLGEILEAADGLCQKGVGITAISLGGQGALVTNSREAYYAPCVKVDVKSTVGAGDSMVAGMLSALTDNAPLDEVLRRAVACATAGITRLGTQLMDMDTYNEIYKRIIVERM